jgi:hypothetical protein
VDPVPDPLLPRKSGSPGNRTLTSGYVSRNFDRKATEAVSIALQSVMSNMTVFLQLPPLEPHSKHRKTYFINKRQFNGIYWGPLFRIACHRTIIRSHA